MTPSLVQIAKRLLELEEKATKGPWKNNEGDAEVITAYTVKDPLGDFPHVISFEYPNGCDNAIFAVAARNSLRPLLSSFIEATKVLEKIAHHKEYSEEQLSTDCSYADAFVESVQIARDFLSKVSKGDG